MSTVKVRFDGRVFVPEEPVNIPAGTVIEVSLPVPNGMTPLAALAEIATLYPDDPDTPTDLAAQHDHYLYGMPKRP